MNRIASDLLGVATDLMPRIKGVFEKNPDCEDREYNSINFEIQRFVSTLRANENLECFVFRRDDEEKMEITVGFTDHEAMQGIIENMCDMFKKIGKKNGIKVKVEIFDEKR